MSGDSNILTIPWFVIKDGDWYCMPSNQIIDTDWFIYVEEMHLSNLVSDRFIEFFTDLNSDFNSLDKCEQRRVFIPFKDSRLLKDGKIMLDFWREVYANSTALYKMEKKENRAVSVWAEMRNKYFDGKAYVYPDEMIQYLNDFSSIELLEFLYYCCIYKERFFTGAYSSYASDGLIGSVLQRLKTVLEHNDTEPSLLK